MKNLGLLDLKKEIAGIMVDLKYSGKNNFTGKDIYGCLNTAFAQAGLVKKLKNANQTLNRKRPGCRFFVFDAARPVTCQWALWNSINLPESKKHVYLADPRRGSIHNYGCALDLSIADEQGNLLDMGTEFDFFGELAQPRCEKKMLKAGRLSKLQLENRMLLRSCMKAAGFFGTSSEWWHFNSCSLRQAKANFKPIP